MRILHVVTLVTPDGAFGGPVRVAANQVAALRARGHEAELVAGQSGYADVAPGELDGAPVRLFGTRRALPTARFSGVLSTGLLRWLRMQLPHTDVVHVHLARDLVTLPAAELARRHDVPFVLQPHGMVIPTSNRLAGPLDALLTRRLLTSSSAVLCLTETERVQVQQLVRTPLPLEQIVNGTPVVAARAAASGRAEVLFCSRLHARKRPVLFARMARDLLARGVEASFVLVGPDEGEAAAVQEVIDEVADPVRLRWEGPLDPAQTLERFSRAGLVVLPSIDEPMPMAVIEAMSVGRAVVVTTSCGLAPVVDATGSGTVVDESYEGLVAGVAAVLDSPQCLAEQGARALATARTHFSMDVVADHLEDVYARAVAAPRRR